MQFAQNYTTGEKQYSRGKSSGYTRRSWSHIPSQMDVLLQDLQALSLNFVCIMGKIPNPCAYYEIYQMIIIAVIYEMLRI